LLDEPGFVTRKRGGSVRPMQLLQGVDVGQGDVTGGERGVDEGHVAQGVAGADEALDLAAREAEFGGQPRGGVVGAVRRPGLVGVERSDFTGGGVVEPVALPLQGLHCLAAGIQGRAAMQDLVDARHQCLEHTYESTHPL
jgi:hypothetical protein